MVLLYYHFADWGVADNCYVRAMAEHGDIDALGSVALAGEHCPASEVD